MSSLPTVSYAAVCRSLSRERLGAYSLEADFDSVDAVARYQWNMALAAAAMPTLHLVEVAFRNAIYSTGVQTTGGYVFRTGQVACWLDATPSLLEPGEAKDVAEATRRLGNSRRRTPGHLVGQLGFGFWLRLCNRPYEHGRAAGPRLWPAATKCFPGCPRHLRNRADICRAFGEIRDFRNLVAHQQPIWDRQPVGWHRRAVELLGWLNPSLAGVVATCSRLEAVFDAGPAAFRANSESILTI